ncbi:hypothetical protein Unana1_06617 [Umbelopsis nana]
MDILTLATAEKSMNDSTLLFEAVEEDDINTVSILLKNGANTEAVNGDGLTPLFVAALNGHLDIMSALIEKGANKEATDRHGWRALHRDAERGDSPVASTLLDEGVAIEVKNDQGDTALHIVAQKNQLLIVKDLLQHGANIDFTDRRGFTVLRRAAEFENKDGANMEAKDTNNGWTPLFLAGNDTKVLSLFIAYGADIRARSNNGIDAISLLLNYDFSIESIDDKGWTALHYAAANNQPIGVTVLQLLLDNGIDPYNKTLDGNTAFHTAVACENEMAIVALLDNGLDVDIRRKNLDTALHMAVRNKHSKLSMLLLNNDANVSARGQNGCTALHYAVVCSDLQTVKTLLNIVYNVNELDDDGNSALDFAVENDDLRMVIALIGSDANVLRKRPQINGKVIRYITKYMTHWEQNVTNELGNTLHLINDADTDIDLSDME